MHFNRLFTMSVSAVLMAACRGGAAAQPRVDESAQKAGQQQQASLPPSLCDLLPQADAERIMSKALVQKRNDDSGCQYQDARGTGGTSLWIYINAFEVKDQCRLTPGSEPLSGVGDEACIALRTPGGLYTTVVFRGGGRTFEVVAPGEDRASERATAVAKAILAKLGS